MHCEKEDLINRINSDLYYDNGKKCVMSRLNILEENMKHIKNLDTNVEILMRYQTQQKTREEVGQESKKDGQWLTGLKITTVLAVATILINILSMIL